MPRHRPTERPSIERATGTEDLATSSQSGISYATNAVTATPDGGSVTVAAPKQSTGTVEAASPDGTTLGMGLSSADAVSGIKSKAGSS